jgi:nucleoid-associated protein EbfC
MDISGMLKQAQKMQSDMQHLQASLADKSVTATVASGKIVATATAAGQITGLKIDPAVIDPADAEMLEALILRAVQDVLAEGRRVAEAEMKKITGGLPLPPGLGF